MKTFTFNEAIQLLTNTEELDDHDRLNLARFIEELETEIATLNEEVTAAESERDNFEQEVTELTDEADYWRKQYEELQED